MMILALKISVLWFMAALALGLVIGPILERRSDEQSILPTS